jgi:thiol-disulfide isomerase/thioredoxin
MMQVLVVVVAVLAVLVVFNLLLSFALIRRLKVLQELVAQTPKRDPALPKLGAAVGPFQVSTPDGEAVSDESLKSGVSLVGFFTPNCLPCSAVKAQLLESPPGMPVVAFVEGHPGDEEAGALAASLQRVARVVFTADDDAPHRAFKPAGYPTLIRVEHGVVAASGHVLADVLP